MLGNVTTILAVRALTHAQRSHSSSTSLSHRLPFVPDVSDRRNADRWSADSTAEMSELQARRDRWRHA
eukprot:2738606-Rhodomonas_salina.1